MGWGEVETPKQAGKGVQAEKKFLPGGALSLR